MHTKKNKTAGMKYSYFCYLVNNRRKKKDLQWMVIQLSIYVLIWTFLTYVYLFL